MAQLVMIVQSKESKQSKEIFRQEVICSDTKSPKGLIKSVYGKVKIQEIGIDKFAFITSTRALGYCEATVVDYYIV